MFRQWENFIHILVTHHNFTSDWVFPEFKIWIMILLHSGVISSAPSRWCRSPPHAHTNTDYNKPQTKYFILYFP